MNEMYAANDLLEPLAALQHMLSALGDRGVIIGGLAASLLGKPRLTADLDAVILCSIEEIPTLLKAAEKENIVPRIPKADDFARKHRVVLLRHKPSGTNIDLSLGVLPFEQELIARSNWHSVGPLKLRLPSPEDLIILKAIAHRPRDLEDIQAILNNYPDLDRKRIRSWVMQFAEALEAPEILEDLDRLLGGSS